jgi:predicted  nucleic acid-binding Zn-ribbon protein
VNVGDLRREAARWRVRARTLEQENAALRERRRELEAEAANLRSVLAAIEERLACRPALPTKEGREARNRKPYAPGAPPRAIALTRYPPDWRS